MARRIRRTEGASIKDIARRVDVSVSSVSVWVRDIELTSEQHAALAMRNVAYNRQMSGTWKQAATRRGERVAYQEEGRAEARAGIHSTWRVACCFGPKVGSTETRCASRTPIRRWSASGSTWRNCPNRAFASPP